MTYRGHIRNGQIVLDEPANLPDGTPVSVEAIAQGGAVGSAAAILNSLEPWDGPSDELDRLLEEVQQARDGDVLPRRDEIE
jgi:hypothetical protein